MNKKSLIKLIGTITFSFLFILLININVFSQNKVKSETAILSGGCFWSMEAMFQKLKGVNSVEPGYAGGFVQNPTYEEVCSGNTQHAESIRINFNPDVISYEKILEVFWKVHNPTTLNRQGADEGTQYRSSIFYFNKNQRAIAEKTKNDIYKSGYWGSNKVVTEIQPYTNFYKAEGYHKDYYNKHSQEGYCVAVIEPKLHKLDINFKNLLK